MVTIWTISTALAEQPRQAAGVKAIQAGADVHLRAGEVGEGVLGNGADEGLGQQRGEESTHPKGKVEELHGGTGACPPEPQEHSVTLWGQRREQRLHSGDQK